MKFPATSFFIVLVLSFGLYSCAEQLNNTKPDSTTVEQNNTTTSDEDNRLMQELVAISPAKGKQLPPPSNDLSGWKPVTIHAATMNGAI